MNCVFDVALSGGWQFAIGVILGVVILVIAYIVLMITYIKTRQKYSGNKYLVEVLYIVAVLVFSFAIKLAIISITLSKNIESGVTAFFYALYNGFGGLVFEGLSEDIGIMSSATLQYLYTGSSILAALIFVSVLATRFNYEIYSYFSLVINRCILKIRKNKDIYIFKCVTSDSLILANSIVETYRTKDVKNKKCLIVFTGQNLPPFDRNDETMKEIMAKGYIYWPYSLSHDKERNKSVLSKLHLYVDNEHFQNKNNKTFSKDYPSIHIFALDNKDTVGKETNNADDIFEEIQMMVKEFHRKNKYYHVNLYVLTNNYLNYIFYDKRLDEICGLRRSDKNGEAQTIQEKAIQAEAGNLRQYFSIHVLNEANLVSRDFINKKIQAFENGGIEMVEELGGVRAYTNTYRVLTLGFGYTGQQATLQTYINSANLSTNFEIDGFEADIFDTKMDSISGIFALQHPLIVCCSSDTPEELEKKKQRIISEKANSYLSRGIKDNKSFKLPVFIFHNASCFNQDFVKFLYKDSNHVLAKKYNLIIIALGDDEINIRAANAIINRLNHESVTIEQHKIVAVNIINQKNICRLDEVKNSDYVHVIAFGCRETIYSYDYIIREDAFMEYNFRYGVIYDEKNHILGPSSGDSLLNSFVKKVILNKKLSLNSQDLDDINQTLTDKFRANTDYIVEKKWQISLFQKQSNVFAALFKPIMASFIRSYPSEDEFNNSADYLVDKFTFLSCVEHERWSRFLIANGWVYNQIRIDSAREHNCLTTFFELNATDRINDLINVIVALSLAKEGMNKK